MELDAEFNEIAYSSDFKILTLASETSLYARIADINCHYLMTLFVCGTQFKHAEEHSNFGRPNLPVNCKIIEKPVEKPF